MEEPHAKARAISVQSSPETRPANMATRQRAAVVQDRADRTDRGDQQGRLDPEAADDSTIRQRVRRSVARRQKRSGATAEDVG